MGIGLYQHLFLKLRLALVGVFFVGCASNELLEKDGGYPQTPPAYTGLPSDRPETKVLSEFAGESILDYTDAGMLTVDNNLLFPTRTQNELGPMQVDDVQSVAEGTIIVSAPTKTMPHGLLRKVSKVVKKSNGTTEIQTIQATLSEAIAGSKLTKEDLKSTTFSAPVDFVLQAVPRSNENQTLATLPQHLSLDEAALATQAGWDFFPITNSDPCKKQVDNAAPGATVTRETCVTVRFWMNAKVDVGWWFVFPYLEGFGASANGFINVNNTLNLSAQVRPEEMKVPLPGNFSYTLLNIDSPPITWMLGPIPIIFTPRITLKLSVGGNVIFQPSLNTTLSTSLANFSFSMGSQASPVQYGFYCGNTVTNGNWGCKGLNNIDEKTKELEKQLLEWNPYNAPFSLSTEGSVKASIDYTGKLQFEAGLYLYGVIGFSGSLIPSIGPRIDLGASYSNALPNQPVVKFRGGIWRAVEGNVWAGVDILGFKIGGKIPIGDNNKSQGIYIVEPKEIYNFFSKCWVGPQLLPQQCQ